MVVILKSPNEVTKKRNYQLHEPNAGSKKRGKRVKNPFTFGLRFSLISPEHTFVLKHHYNRAIYSPSEFFSIFVYIRITHALWRLLSFLNGQVLSVVFLSRAFESLKSPIYLPRSTHDSRGSIWRALPRQVKTPYEHSDDAKSSIEFEFSRNLFFSIFSEFCKCSWLI